MFGKSTTSRFAGPGSYYQHANDENAPANTMPSSARGNKPPRSARKTPLRPPRSPSTGAPSYMQPTTASSAKKAAPSSKSERLNFSKGEGSDTLGPMQVFGKDTKGATPMKKGKHGRFSIADSYFVIEKPDGADSCGLNHEEKKINDKCSGIGIAPMNSFKGDRFGKGSYLEESMSKPVSEFTISHGDISISDFGTGTSSFHGRTERDDWVRENSSLRDRDLALCEGRHRLGETDSSFKINQDGLEGSAFMDTTERFQNIKLLPGQQNIGAELRSDFQEKPSVVYKKNTKHGRFSEFGAIYQKEK